MAIRKYFEGPRTKKLQRMSYKISALVWERSAQKSGNLLVLLAIAEHADDQGAAWPGVPLLARKTRLSRRHVRRCLHALVSSGELEILPERSPGGGPWYQIRTDWMTLDNLSSRTPSTTGAGTLMSNKTDAHGTASTCIREPSIKPSVEPIFPKRSDGFNRNNSSLKRNKWKTQPYLDFSTEPKAGF
jgi:hypothetical protein